MHSIKGYALRLLSTTHDILTAHRVQISFFLPNMTWIQPPGYVHVMFTDTWQGNGLNVTVDLGKPPAANQSSCNYYAYFSDKGCRTYSLGDATCKLSHDSIATLYKRHPGTNQFSLFSKGNFCAQQADFQDGPAAAESDEICKQHCLHGDRGTSAPAASVSASAQQSDDGTTVVVRLANTASTAQNISIVFSGTEFAEKIATTWLLSSSDGLAANTPANPTNVAPVKGTLSFGDTFALAPLSVLVATVSK